MVVLLLFTVKLFKLLSTEAVRRNHSTSGATDAEIQQEIVKFLHGAQDRDGGRRNRQKKALERESSIVNDNAR